MATPVPRLDAIKVPEVPQVEVRPRRTLLLKARSGFYSLLILAVALVAGAYSLRTYGIFSCQASGYGSDGYLGYCGATSYGDYDHGALWFDLEPTAFHAAENARALFIGNSRTVFGFSTQATADWFSSLSESYYLLGFTYFENYTFEAPLLRKLHPKARVYVINIDTFFDQATTAPGAAVMRDGSAKSHYREKQNWQKIHKVICQNVSTVCGNHEAIFRSRSTGAWLVSGDRFTSAPVTYDHKIDEKKLASYTVSGRKFLPTLDTDPGCTILTIVPMVNTEIGTAKAIAAALDLKLVAPEVPGLVTFDHYHLDRGSAQRWSTAFFEEAGPQIEKCLNQQAESAVAMSSAQ